MGKPPQAGGICQEERTGPTFQEEKSCNNGMAPTPSALWVQGFLNTGGACQHPIYYLIHYSIIKRECCLELSLCAGPRPQCPHGLRAAGRAKGASLDTDSKPQQWERKGHFRDPWRGRLGWNLDENRPGRIGGNRPAGPRTSGSPRGLVIQGCKQRHALTQFLLFDNHSNDHGGKRRNREAA